MSYEYKVLIPKERVAVLIGEKRSTKKMIEKRTGTKLIVKEEEVTIISEDSYKGWVTQSIIKAIGRGFKPTKALMLLNEGYELEIIEIMDYGNTKKDKVRLKGRVIGEEGRSRKFIERETRCFVSVYGKTVSIIGPQDKIGIAKRAVEMLLSGAQHHTVYKYIAKKMKEMKLREMGLI